MKKTFASAITFLFILLPVYLLSQDAKFYEKTAEAIVDGDEPEYTEAVSFIRVNRPPEIVDLLKQEYLDEDDADVRRRIISALKIYPLTDYPAVWTEILHNTEDSSIEIEIMELLATVDNNPFTLAIAEKLSAPRTEVRQMAARILGKIGDDKILPVILALGSSREPINRIYFLEALNYLYDQRFQKTVITLLSDENKSVRIFTLKCVRINEIKEALPQIRNIVRKDENPEVRRMGIELIVFFKDTSSGGMLIDILKEEDRDLRLEAIKALAELRYSAAAQPISRLLLKEQDDRIKSAALDALAVFKKSGELEGVEHVLKHELNAEIRARAAYVLGEMKDDAKALDILEASLTDKDEKVRSEICNSLGNFRKGRSSEILLGVITSDSSRYVRTSSLYALVRINDPKNLVKLFDIYSVEHDMVFRMILGEIIRTGIVRNIK